MEWVAAVFFVGLGLVGLWVSPLFLATALALHGLWSLLRSFTALGDGQPESYARFCVAFDLVLAGFVAYIWTVGV